MIYYNITLASKSKLSLDLYLEYLKSISKLSKIDLSISSFPTKIKKITLLKSPHVYKRAKESFEVRSYKRLVNIKSTFNLTKLLSNKPKSIFLTVKSLKK